MSDLEKYIFETRDELDRMESLDEEALWQGVQGRLAQPEDAVLRSERRSSVRWRWWAIAASVVALVGWGLLFFQKHQPPAATDKTAQPPNEQVAPAVAESETQPSAPDSAETLAAPPPAGHVLKEKNTQKAGPERPHRILSSEEARLQKIVASKVAELGLDQLDSSAYREIFIELAELERSAQEAQRDAVAPVMNERAVETLRRYYELKIRILENLSREIQTRKRYENLEKRS